MTDCEANQSQFYNEEGGELPKNQRSVSGTVMTTVGQSAFFSRPSDDEKSKGGKFNNIINGKSSTKKKGTSDSVRRVRRQAEASHFHYETVEFSSFTATLCDDGGSSELTMAVTCGGNTWTVHQDYAHLRDMDNWLHNCVMDRHISELEDLDNLPTNTDAARTIIRTYLILLSKLSQSYTFNCGTVLNFFEMDNKGQHLSTNDDSPINIPAVAAAYVIKRYVKQADDELSLEVGDMVSVIDKPRPEESLWWRGKKSLEVGFFPSECVEVIGVKLPNAVAANIPQTKPVLQRRGKLITFLRTFFSNRPQRTVLKQSGIVQERVFGCDLGEHLNNSGLDVPQVLKCCCQAIEVNGLIDGIYRLSGVASSIQKLRADFDEGLIESLSSEEHLADLHTITAVLKMYFRELPNPLLTYQLYESFAAAVCRKSEERLTKLKVVLARLPPPHYRTTKYLFSHLHTMAQKRTNTGMDSRNLAIVWSPNLMKCKAMDGANVSGEEMLHHVSIQATVVESLISNYDELFCGEVFYRSSDVSWCEEPDYDSVADRSHSYINISVSRSVSEAPPSSFYESVDGGEGRGSWTSIEENENGSEAVTRKEETPSRLITLSEAQERLSGGVIPTEDVIPVFHTIIDFDNKKKPGSHRNRSGSGGQQTKQSNGWRSIFRKSGKRAHSSSDPEEIITDSEINHLARAAKLTSSSTSNLILLQDGQECDTSVEKPESMTRSASLDSFFEQPPSSVSVEAPAVLETRKPTPGVVFRPAYNLTIDQLMNQYGTKVTWRGRLQESEFLAAAKKPVTVHPATGPMPNQEGLFLQSTSPRPQPEMRPASPVQEEEEEEEEPIYETVNAAMVAAWEESETRMVVQQARQARLSRSSHQGGSFRIPAAAEENVPYMERDAPPIEHKTSPTEWKAPPTEPNIPLTEQNNWLCGNTPPTERKVSPNGRNTPPTERKASQNGRSTPPTERKASLSGRNTPPKERKAPPMESNTPPFELKAGSSEKTEVTYAPVVYTTLNKPRRAATEHAVGELGSRRGQLEEAETGKIRIGSWSKRKAAIASVKSSIGKRKETDVDAAIRASELAMGAPPIIGSVPLEPRYTSVKGTKDSITNTAPNFSLAQGMGNSNDVQITPDKNIMDPANHYEDVCVLKEKIVKDLTITNPPTHTRSEITSSERNIYMNTKPIPMIRKGAQPQSERTHPPGSSMQSMHNDRIRITPAPQPRRARAHTDSME